MSATIHDPPKLLRLDTVIGHEGSVGRARDIDSEIYPSIASLGSVWFLIRLNVKPLSGDRLLLVRGPDMTIVAEACCMSAIDKAIQNGSLSIS